MLPTCVLAGQMLPSAWKAGALLAQRKERQRSPEADHYCAQKDAMATSKLKTKRNWPTRRLRRWSPSPAAATAPICSVPSSTLRRSRYFFSFVLCWMDGRVSWREMQGLLNAHPCRNSGFITSLLKKSFMFHDVSASCACATNLGGRRTDHHELLHCFIRSRRSSNTKGPEPTKQTQPQDTDQYEQ